MPYDNTNSGVLFKNDRKTEPKHPDYSGEINVGGQVFWLSAWIKEGKKGKFMSLSVKPKEDRQRSVPAPKSNPHATPNLSPEDSDLPF